MTTYFYILYILIRSDFDRIMYLFITDITCMDEAMFKCGLELVSPYRREKIEKYKYEEDKKRSLAAGLLLNYATKCFVEHKFIKDCVNKVSIKDILNVYDNQYDYKIVTIAKGKPIFESENIYFSISHCGDYAVCAVSYQNIGVDIEVKRKKGLKVAKRFFKKSECEWIEDSEERFLKIWTLKEAYAKYTGEGIANVLPHIEFEYDDENNIHMKKDNAYIQKIKIYQYSNGQNNTSKLNIIKSDYVISVIEKAFD